MCFLMFAFISFVLICNRRLVLYRPMVIIIIIIIIIIVIPILYFNFN